MFERFASLRAPATLAGLTGLLLVLSGCDQRVNPLPAVSPNGQDLFNLYNVISIPAIFIFLLVEILLLICIVRFRRRAQPAGYVPPQWHGNMMLEIVWTAIPTLILAFIGWISVATLFSDFQAESLKADINITVTGRQFEWDYTYEGSSTAAGTPYTLKQVGNATGQVTPFVVPTGRLIKLKLHGEDVIHSWWVPQITGKTDSVPGYDNYTWMKIDTAGLYRGECAELCGAGHYTMQILVKAVSQDEYDTWLAQQIAAQNQPTPSPSATP